MPIVSTKRQGLCGVLADSERIVRNCGVTESYGRDVRQRTWKQEHFPFVDVYVTFLALIYHSQKHGSLVLIKPFLEEGVANLSLAKSVESPQN